MPQTTPSGWRKSSYSSNNGGDCVEVAPVRSPFEWRKSSHSGNNGGDCIEVATALTAVPVRDSKSPDLGHLTITETSWSALLEALQAT
ncbi:DUF397 domain-containing protein [Embleya hyalina]|uniref:Toxin n=1 Tax=Embleya hyalina TaxID=516124 RepID=A0A401Z706_9ACTN|nr:DUF397 domain-containing protein [Embleya hyalina]GCE02619.1 toxin [Embleya hyalina]